MTVQHTEIYRGIDMRFGSIQYLSSEWVLSDDDELVQRVVAHVQNRLGSQVRSFQMSAREDGLILRGQVRSHYGKQMVQEVVMQISDYSILANDIEVLPTHLAEGGYSH